MSTLALFFLGLLVTAVLTFGVFLASLSEAADPGNAAEETLSDLERRLIGKIREKAKLEEEEARIARQKETNKLV